MNLYLSQLMLAALVAAFRLLEHVAKLESLGFVLRQAAPVLVVQLLQMLRISHLALQRLLQMTDVLLHAEE